MKVRRRWGGRIVLRAIAIGLPLAVLILSVTLPERRDKPWTLYVPRRQVTGLRRETPPSHS
ncbi:hypothetical protein ACWCPQ_08195 [Nocardia sp. NPDC001965]